MTVSANTGRLYLRHILECIATVNDDCAGGRDVFDRSRTTRDAVLRNLQVMAESTQRLSDRAKAARPEIPWDNVAGFRNRLVHDYFQIDHDLIWRVVSSHLPPLALAATDLLQRLDSIWATNEPREPESS